ncbi:MAG: hypothetical protein QW680_13225 [Pyrobaculum sp.]|uniref:Uncharacterized protein n=1 Tax=Pyrobaculum aerophilum TaxID=13773 RepID=A0A832SZP0_9CREN|nr:hypothetical protein [Pyrobaculum aerophilum]HII47987.1 hypothetical protein [Pyrobaculum aerophilum]
MPPPLVADTCGGVGQVSPIGGIYDAATAAGGQAERRGCCESAGDTRRDSAVYFNLQADCVVDDVENSRGDAGR